MRVKEVRTQRSSILGSTVLGESPWCSGEEVDSKERQVVRWSLRRSPEEALNDWGQGLGPKAKVSGWECDRGCLDWERNSLRRCPLNSVLAPSFIAYPWADDLISST